MSFDLLFTNEASIEIFDAYNYYEFKKLGLGEVFLEYLDNCIEKIQIDPFRFPMKRAPYREAVVRKFPFVIIFEIRKKEIVIFSVFNTWKDPKKKP